MAKLAVLSIMVFTALAAVATGAADEACAQAASDEPTSLIQEFATFARSKGGAAAQPQAASTWPKEMAWAMFSDPTEISLSAALAEYIAMTLFVVIGCGSAMGIAKEPGAAWVLQVSLTFGFAITSLAYAVGAYSGGQINCAVTLGLVLVGNVTVTQGILNFVAQMLGSLTGAYILTTIFPKDQDRTGGLGSNGIGEGFTTTNAFVGEAAMTFLLMFVVLETAVNPNSQANRALACVAIGFAVFLAHTVLIPIDGCSINPTRSFGPAFVAKQLYGKADTMKDMPVFFAAPCLGAALAAGVYHVLRSMA